MLRCSILSTLVNLVQVCRTFRNTWKKTYFMTIFASGLEREIQQFDWFLELAVPDR